MKENFSACTNLNECLQHLLNSIRVAVAVSRTEFQQHSQVQTNRIYCFNKAENIHNFSISLNIRKGFEHFEAVIDIVQRAFETGLIQKWQNDEKLHQNFKIDNVELLQTFDSISLPTAISFILIIWVIIGEFIINQRIQWLNYNNYF